VGTAHHLVKKSGRRKKWAFEIHRARGREFMVKRADSSCQSLRQYYNPPVLTECELRFGEMDCNLVVRFCSEKEAENGRKRNPLQAMLV